MKSYKDTIIYSVFLSPIPIRHRTQFEIGSRQAIEKNKSEQSDLATASSVSKGIFIIYDVFAMSCHSFKNQ